MISLLRSVFYVVTVLFFAALVGCGSDGFEKVTGTVKYTDGTLPTSEMATITFEPKEPGSDFKGASGDIGEDGTFELTTIEPGDGAMPGDYIVTVKIMDGYPDIVFAVEEKYTDVSQSPLSATVTSGKNHFEFEVERP